MTIRASFQPDRGTNQVESPAAATASVPINAEAKSVRLVNSGANICHVRIGRGTQEATVADMPVRPLSEIVVSKGPEDVTLAHISAAGTTLHIQTGEGGV